jgi:hypothetical protein
MFVGREEASPNNQANNQNRYWFSNDGFHTILKRPQ